MTRRRVLLIAYQFPPVGGAGVQRPAKFTKYLPEFGWDVTVLTCSNPSTPLRDESLVETYPDGVVIHRVRTLEPGYGLKAQAVAAQQAPSWRPRAALMRLAGSTARTLLQPDAQLLWYPSARRAARRILRETPHHAVMVTAPPFSALLLGVDVAREAGLPLISDFRDEWDISRRHLENASRASVSGWMQGAMQRRVLRASKAIIATTRASAEALTRRATAAGSQATVEHIYNGWDADDVPTRTVGVDFRSPEQPFRVLYTGTLWNLTDVGPLVTALATEPSAGVDLQGRIELIFIGRRTPEQDEHLDRLVRAGFQVRREPYIPHQEVVREMAAADALLVLLANTDDARRVVPGKLFEYIAVGRRILAICPSGETADLVHQVGGDWIHPADATTIRAWFTERGDGADADPVRHEQAAVADPFSRRHLTGQLAAVLDRASGVQPMA